MTGKLKINAENEPCWKMRKYIIFAEDTTNKNFGWVLEEHDVELNLIPPPPTPVIRSHAYLGNCYLNEFNYKEAIKKVLWLGDIKVEKDPYQKNKQEFEEYFNNLPEWNLSDYYGYSPHYGIIELFDCKTGERISEDIEKEYEIQNPEMSNEELMEKLNQIVKKYYGK